MKKNTQVGGQAVIEGVMMRGINGIATAVRLPDNTITVDFKNSIPYTKRNKFLSLPIIRGFVSLVESLVIGIKSLYFSAAFFEDDEEDSEPSKFDVWFENTFKDKGQDIIMFISLIFSIVISVGLFFILPTCVANILKKIHISNTFYLNIFEGLIRVSIFLMYIFLIGKVEDVSRVFQYHGAEHKTIFCYESGMDLTPENAKKFGRLHPRCGTNFIFLVMIISILIFSLTGWSSIYKRIMYRIILLPVVSGVTYEVIKWMGKSESKISKIFSYPGLMLQKITTKEPDLEQLEVAIKALKVAEGIDKDEYKMVSGDGVENK